MTGLNFALPGLINLLLLFCCLLFVAVAALQRRVWQKQKSKRVQKAKCTKCKTPKNQTKHIPHI